MAHVFDRERQLLAAPQAQPERLACGSVRLGPDIECRSWSDEEIDFYMAGLAEFDHFQDLVVGQQHDAAPLADAMHRHVELIGLLQNRTERQRPFRAGDLDPELGTVRESLRGGRGRVRVARR